MLDRPTRNCESRFRRHSHDENLRRRSVGREQIVAGRRRLGDSVLKTPTITRVAPVCFTPNPRLTPNPSTEEISSNTYPQVVSSELVDSNSNSVIKSYAELLQDAEEDAGDGISVIDSYPEPRPEPADLDSSLSRAD